MATAESVILALQAKDDGFTSTLNRAAQTTDAAMGKVEKSADRAEKAVTKSAANRAKAEVEVARANLEAAKKAQIAASQEVAAAEKATKAVRTGRASIVLAARESAKAKLDEARAFEQSAIKEVAAEEKAVKAAQRASDQKQVALRKAEKAAQREAASADRAQPAGNGLASRLSTKVGGLVGAYVGAQTVREYLDLADTYKNLQTQLKLATAEFGNLGVAQKDVNRIAANTRGGLEETATLYANFVRASQQSGRSQEQAARATETFSKALKIGGADAQSAASATLQFGQALASGVLRGDEFNSIAEASPRILKLLADSMGIPQGALRALAAEGKLTSDILFKALTEPEFTGKIDSEFQQLPITFDQSMTLVKNSAINTIGEFDQGGQFSNAIASFIQQTVTGFGDISSGAEQTGIDTRAAFDGLGDVFAPLLSGAQSAFAGIRSDANYTRDAIANILGVVDALRNGPRNVANFIQGGNADFRKATGFKGLPQSTLASTYLAGDRVSRARGRRDSAARKLEAQGFIVPRNDDGSVDEANIRRKPVAPRIIPAPVAAKTKKAGGGPKGPSQATLDKKEETSRQKAIRAQQAFDTQVEALNAELLAAQRSQVTDVTEIARLASEQVEAEARKKKIAYDAAEKAGGLTKAQADLLRATVDQIESAKKAAIEQDKQTAIEAQRLQAAQSDLRDQGDILQAAAQLAERSDERKAIELQLLDLKYQELRLQEQAVIDSKTATEAQKDIARARLGTLGTLQKSETTGVEQRSRGQYETYRKGIAGDFTTLQETVDGIKVDALRSLEDTLVNSAKAALGLSGALGDVVGQIIRIGIERKLIGPLADALFGKANGSSSGGLGGLLSSVIGAFGGGSGGLSKSWFEAGRAGLAVPKLAGGGTIRAGGMGGVDQNVLSVNGVPRAMISAHETLSVTNPDVKALAPAGNTTIVNAPQFNLRGAIVTRELYADMQRISQESAAQAGRVAYGQAVKDAPAAVARAQRFGG